MRTIAAARREAGLCSDYDHALLEEFFLPVFESGLVHTFYMLPDWESSTGASWEHVQAQRLSIDIVYLTDEY